MPGIVDISEVLVDLGLAETVTEAERTVVQGAIVRAEGAVKRYIGYDPVQRSRTEYYPQASRMKTSGAGQWIVEGQSAVFRSTGVGSGSRELFMKHIPIRSVTQLAVDWDGRSDARADSFTDIKAEGTDFWPNYDARDSSDNQICRDGIIRNDGTWPSVAGSVKISYVGGYSEDEFHGQDTSVDASPIWGAVINEAVRSAKKAFTQAKQRFGFIPGMLTGERLGDYSYSISPGTVTQLFGGIADLLPETKQLLNDYVNWGNRIAG